MKNAKLLVVALIVAAILSVSAVGAAEISFNATSSDPTQVPHEQVVSVAEPTSVQEVETTDLESSDDKGIDINNEIKLDSDELRSTNFKESLSRNDDSILGVSFDENILSAPIVNGSKIYPSGQTFQDIRDCIEIAMDGNIIDLGGQTYRGTHTFFNVTNNITIINGILNPSGNAKVGMSFTNCSLINITFQNFYYENGLSWPINFNKAVLTNVSFINMSFPVAFGTGENSKFEGCKFINLTSRLHFDATNYEWGAMLILYTSEVNNSLFYNCTTNRHSGAICVAGRTGGSKPGNIVNITNSNFINCRAGIGGAIYVHGTNTDENYHSNIINCNFTNCSAISWGGALGSSQNYLNVEDCNFINNTAKKGAAYMVGGINGTALDGYNEQGHNNTMKNCYFFNNIGSEEGGAVHMTGDYNSAIDCVFDDNFAINGTGAAIYVKGNHSTIHNSNFTNHEAEMGTVYVEGNYLNCTDSYFEGNVASHGGSGIYVEGDYTLINNTLFENNNASRHGGAVHSIGDNARILNSQFYYNNAIPSLDNPDYGLGGAVFIDGDHNEISFSQFKYNTARNGSAIYNRGDNLTLIDDTFDHNQAWSYLLFTESKPQESYWSEDLETLVNVTLEGGDNLINAIYNDRTVEHITFHNVTYYIKPTQLYPTGKRTTGPGYINPVDGVEKSEGGKYLYQDSREDNQVIKVNITYDGKKVYEYEGKTDMYGNVLLSIKKEDLADGQYRVGTYNVFASHPDDTIYTAIENTTLFKVNPHVDVSVTKTSDKDVYFVGENAIFTIRVYGVGTNATNVKVRDILPKSLEFVSAVAEQGEYDSVNNVWNVGDLPHDNSRILYLTVKTTEIGTFDNVVNVTCSEQDWNMSNNVDNKTIHVDLYYTKEASVEKTFVGKFIEYYIKVYNLGSTDYREVVRVSDLLPEGIVYAGNYTVENATLIQYTGSLNAQMWDITDIPAKKYALITIKALAIKEGIWNNTVQVWDYPPVNATVNVSINADLEVIKVVSDKTPKYGDEITWTVTVTNHGPNDAEGVYVEDLLPYGLIYVSDDSNGAYANGKWVIGDLKAGGEAVINIKTIVDIVEATITNVAVVNSTTPDDNESNNKDNDTITVGPSCDLEITKTVNNSNPKKDEIVTWTIIVYNHGPSRATDVYVMDLLPEGVTYLSDDSGGDYKNGVWNIGNMERHSEAVIKIKTLVTLSNKTITNVAVVNSTTPDTNESNNKDNDTIKVPPVTDLAIEKIVSNHTPKMGNIIIWTVTVTNNGPDTAVNTVVNDVLPAGLIFVRSDGNYANNVWTIGDLANGSSATLRIWTQVDVTAAVITNVANVTSDTPDSDLTNNNDSATIDVGHEADLEVIKIVSNHTPKMGNIIIWTVTVTNNGPDGAVDVIVTDVLPEGLIYIKDDSNGKYKNNVWTIGTLNNKETVTLEITTEVAISNANITNVAVVTSDTYDPNETNNEDNDTIEVLPVADLAIEKIVSNHTPKMGNIIIWTVTVTNNGPDTAVNTVVNDVLPAGLIFVRSDGNYANNVWTIGDLANGSSATLRIWTQVDVTAAVITNVANVTSDTPDSDLTNNNDSATIDVGHEADLEVIKIVSNHTPNKGDIIIWTVTVTNNGPDGAVDVIVTDVLPEGLIYIKDDSNGKYKNNVWTIGTLNNKETVTLEITTEVAISNANITNVAVVTSDTYDPNETNNEDNDTIEVPPMADVEITKVVSNPKPRNGDEITWTITVVNHGPDDAVNVVVSDNLPAGLIYVSDDGNGAYDSKTGLWNVGDLHRGRGLVLNIVAKVSITDTNITNVAVVTSDTYDPNETNNEDNDTVEIKPIVDLAIKKSVNNHTPKMGNIIIWTVTVTNNGPDTAVNTVVNDVLPAGLIFVRSDGNYANNVWTIGDLAKGSSATLRIWTQVDVTAAVITNVANVTSDTPDSDLTNNNDSATIDVGHEADLEVQKIVSNPTPNKGDIITWTIIVINHGPDNAVDVAVTDVLPEGLIYIKDDSNGKYKNNVWTIGTLESKTFTALQITTEVAISNANITNVAVVTSDTHDPNETNNKDNDTIEVPPAADLEIAKVASVSQAYYGDNVNWTIVVFNKGPDAAVNVVVEDVLPDGLIYISDDGEGAYDSASGKWTVGNLSVRGWAALNIVSKVATYNTNITNVAVVTSDTYDPNETNNKDNDTVETKPLTDLSVVKTSDKDEYFVGDIAVWTVTIHNAANGTDATNIYVDDFFPGDYFEIISWTVSKGTFEKWIGNEYMWKIASMGNGTDATLTIVSRAKAPRGEITNFVQTFCDEDEWDYENNLDKKSVDVIDIPNPIKSVDNPEPYYNDEIVYNLTIINTGNTVYTNYLTVVDSLPAGLEFVGVDSVSGADVLSFDESTLTWVLTNIDYKAPAVITVRVKVSDVGSLTNNLTVVGPDGTTKTVNCTVDVPFADLEVVKFVSNATVHKGDAVIWTIVVTNNGPNLAEGVYVKDVLPKGLIFIGADGDYDPVTGIWTVGDLISGESRSLAIGTVANITNANVTNVAVVNSTTHDPDLTNNKANNTTNVPPEADIEVVKEVDASESVKDQIVVWTITMSNKGPDGAENVLVKDNLPDTLIFISADGDYDPSTGIWTIDYLASGEVRVLHIITKVNTTNEVIVNNVTVTSGTYDPDMENNKANNTTKVGPLADLEIVKIVSDSTPHKGDVITWTIVVMNIGPDMAEDVTVSDKLPAGLIFVGADGDYNPATGIWTVGTLNNGEFKSLVITTIVNITNANVTNVAVVNSTTPDSNKTNNRDNDTAEIEPEADIAVIKYASNPKPVQGDVITWTVVVTNNGPDVAEDVSVAEYLPVGLKLISARGSKGTYENGIWTVGTLNNGDVEILVLTTEVTASKGIIENIVVATGSTYDPNETNNRDNESVVPEPLNLSADLEVIKTANVEKVKVGDKIVWTITVINHGPGVAKNVRVADVAMGDIEYVSSGASKGLFDPVSGIWIIGDMENGESAVLTLEFKALSAGTVINAAVVVSDTPDPNEDNNKDKSVVIVEPVSPAPAAAKSPVSEAPVTMHATGNPIVMVLLALLAVVGVTLRRKD